MRRPLGGCKEQQPPRSPLALFTLRSLISLRHGQRTVLSYEMPCSSQFAHTCASAVGIAAIILSCAPINGGKGGRAAKTHGKSQARLAEIFVNHLFFDKRSAYTTKKQAAEKVGNLDKNGGLCYNLNTKRA